MKIYNKRKLMITDFQIMDDIAIFEKYYKRDIIEIINSYLSVYGRR